MLGLSLSLWAGQQASGGGAPANTAAPVISGTQLVASTLSTTDGTWSGSPSFTYQWRRAGSNISAATSNTYVQVAADIGSNIDCVVTGTNASGSASANASAVGPVQYWGVVSNRGRTHTNSAGISFQESNSRTPLAATQALVSGQWRIAVSAFACTSSGAGIEVGNAATVLQTCAIEYPAGTFTAVTFGGTQAAGVTHPSGTAAGVWAGGGAAAISDLINVDVPSGQGWARLHQEGTGGIFYVTSTQDTAGGDKFEFSASITHTDKTMGGTVNQTSSGKFQPFMAILAPTTQAVAGIWGDSIAWGQNDTAIYTGRYGIIATALGASQPFFNFSCFGQQVLNVMANSPGRQVLAPYFSTLIVTLGVNDVFSGSNPNNLAANIIANRATVISSIKALNPNIRRTVTTTITPEATSTGNFFVSDASQTGKTNFAQGTLLNSTIVGGTNTGADTYWNTGGALRSLSKLEVWLNDGVTNNLYVVTDGVHPNHAGYAVGAAQVNLADII